MTRYHCPYCSIRYQIHRQRADGVMVCGQCGDPLVEVPLVRPTQIFALVAAVAFVAPFILMMIAFIQDQKKPGSQRALVSMEVISVIVPTE